MVASVQVNCFRKFYDWRERYGKVNEHNGWVPRDFWLEDCGRASQQHEW